jgi:hypothetical protein
MSPLTRTFGRALLVAACLGMVGPIVARAQDDTPEAHFARGIELFNEGRHDAALAEFERAYALEPAFQVLYNIGRVHAALGHAVEAADAYERYLAVGGAHVPAARRREVEAALLTQRSRIGRLMVRTAVEGAIVSVDGHDVATTPLSTSIPLSAGSHVVEVRALGHELVRRAVQIAGGVEELVVAELHASAVARGSLRIVSRIPDVAVSIDGETIGRTPLTSAVEVPAGQRQLRAVRPGYDAYERTVTVNDGVELVVELDLVRDPNAPTDTIGTMVFRVPDAPHIARIDGEPVTLTEPVTLPVGRHRVVIEMADRLPWEETIEVLGGERRDLRPELDWTPATRAALRREASGQHTAGLATSMGGGVAVLAGAALMTWNEVERAATTSEADELRPMLEANCTGGSITELCPDLQARAREINAELDTQTTLRWAFGITLGVGAAVTALGLAILLGVPSEKDIDARARAFVAIAPLEGGLALATTLPIP